MTTDTINYQYEKNLEIYFDNLELLAQKSFTSSVRWRKVMMQAAAKNRELDGRFYRELQWSSSDKFLEILSDMMNRIQTDDRVIVQSSMNGNLD